MEMIKEKAIKQALKILDATGCIYAVKDPDGNVHGELQVVEKKTRSGFFFPKGTIANHVEANLKSMSIGDVVQVPVLDYGAERVRGGISAWFIKNHGANAHTASVSKDHAFVEVLRIS